MEDGANNTHRGHSRFFINFLCIQNRAISKRLPAESIIKLTLRPILKKNIPQLHLPPQKNELVTPLTIMYTTNNRNEPIDCMKTWYILGKTALKLYLISWTIQGCYVRRVQAGGLIFWGRDCWTSMRHWTGVQQEVRSFWCFSSPDRHNSPHWNSPGACLIF